MGVYGYEFQDVTSDYVFKAKWHNPSYTCEKTMVKQVHKAK